jgi:hypothetical protein
LVEYILYKTLSKARQSLGDWLEGVNNYPSLSISPIVGIYSKSEVAFMHKNIFCARLNSMQASLTTRRLLIIIHRQPEETNEQFSF